MNFWRFIRNLIFQRTCATSHVDLHRVELPGMVAVVYQRVYQASKDLFLIVDCSLQHHHRVVEDLHTLWGCVDCLPITHQGLWEHKFGHYTPQSWDTQTTKDFTTFATNFAEAPSFAFSQHRSEIKLGGTNKVSGPMWKM